MLMSRPSVRSSQESAPSSSCSTGLQISLREESCSHTIRVLCIQNRRTCGAPVGLVLPQPVPASEGIAPDRYRGTGSQSHWALPRSQDACVIVPELQILTPCHTEAGKC